MGVVLKKKKILVGSLVDIPSRRGLNYPYFTINLIWIMRNPDSDSVTWVGDMELEWLYNWRLKKGLGFKDSRRPQLWWVTWPFDGLSSWQAPQAGTNVQGFSLKHQLAWFLYWMASYCSDLSTCISFSGFYVRGFLEILLLTCHKRERALSQWWWIFNR